MYFFLLPLSGPSDNVYDLKNSNRRNWTSEKGEIFCYQPVLGIARWAKILIRDNLLSIRDIISQEGDEPPEKNKR